VQPVSQQRDKITGQVARKIAECNSALAELQVMCCCTSAVESASFAITLVYIAIGSWN